MKKIISLFFIVLPILVIPLSSDAKLRCKIRECKKIGGMEVTLRTYDRIREGSKLNILKIRRKVARARARVNLTNYYYEKGVLFPVHREPTTKTGRSAKKVKLRHWSMPFEGGAYVGVRGSCDPYFDDCHVTRPTGGSGGFRWVGFDGKWDGVCAIAEVTINGDTKKIASSSGWVPEGTCND